MSASLFIYLFIYYPFALNTYYNDANQEVQLKARKSQEAVEAYKEIPPMNYNKVINYSKVTTTVKFLILRSVCRLNRCLKATKKRLPISWPAVLVSFFANFYICEAV